MFLENNWSSNSGVNTDMTEPQRKLWPTKTLLREQKDKPHELSA